MPVGCEAVYPDLSGCSYPTVVLGGPMDQQAYPAAPPCAYSSVRGDCQGRTVSNSSFCQLHACPAPGCTASKASSAQYCAAHGMAEQPHQGDEMAAEPRQWHGEQGDQPDQWHGATGHRQWQHSMCRCFEDVPNRTCKPCSGSHVLLNLFMQ